MTSAVPCSVYLASIQQYAPYSVVLGCLERLRAGNEPITLAVNMSAWRRKALDLFPDLRKNIEDPDTSIMSLFFELLPLCRDAHDRGDSEELRKIYSFADWCASQKTNELWNAAGVGFYEHLADSKRIFDAIPLWVRKPIFEDIAGLLEARVGVERVAELRRRYR